ncbi:MAG: hypothetical protein L0H15_02355 [Nitrosospira sp.]|nr:hypothetical protein [Nitrosospira sp.]
MKHNFNLQHALARPAVLVGILIFTAAGISHAQGGSEEQASASMPETRGFKAAQSGREDSAEDRGKTPQKKDVDAAGHGRHDGPDASSNEKCAEQEANACEQPAPEQESFLRRIIKLFYGRDRPPGPNPDVDTNISAGGAGGG